MRLSNKSSWAVSLRIRKTFWYALPLLRLPLRGGKGGAVSRPHHGVGFSLLTTTHYPLPTTHYPLPTAHYPLPTNHYPLTTAHCPLPTTHYPLPTTHCPLPTTHCPLPTTHCPLTTNHQQSFSVSARFLLGFCSVSARDCTVTIP